MTSVACSVGRRASAVRRQVPSADPSARAGKLSRPDADTASADGGSRRSAGSRASRRTAATTAAHTWFPSLSHSPGAGCRDGDGSLALASGVPSSQYAATFTALEPTSTPTRLTLPSPRAAPRRDRHALDHLIATHEPQLVVQIARQPNVFGLQRDPGVQRRHLARPFQRRVLL